ncbi:MAG: acylneuraminate cytidylyltransferase family protein [Deltaproteobacteria bacterium]|nr:acylneuraminate cytidylyltransferase family protein [Deltaproteobacteria bacterium]
MIIGLIPARAGSKGVPKKNIKLLAGYPLIAYSIVASKLALKIDRTIVSTDSEEFAEIARRYGAEVPFIRPKEISQDRSDAIEYVKHVIEWFKTHETTQPEYLVLLCPPTPLRDPVLVDQSINKILQHDQATSLRSAKETQESPYKLFAIKDDYYEGLFPDDPRPEYYNLPRQAFPPVYHPNGYVDIIKTSTVTNTNTLNGSRILSFITPDVGEIDRPQDFEFVEFMLGKIKNPIHEYLVKNFPRQK